MSAIASFSISQAQKDQYREQGYFILERVIPEEHLRTLRDECRQAIDEMNAEMDRNGADVLGLNHRNSRYFVPFRSRKSAGIRRFLFSQQMAEICRATIGDTAYLFLDQYVVKGAEVGMKFAWHQDSGYIATENPPYVSCWCTLDDVNEENGTVYILPYDRAGTRTKTPHVKEEGTNDMIGYFGDDPGIPVNVPAGSIAVFSCTTFHRSGPNTTDRMRRIYLAQYSDAPILTDDGTRPRHLDDPFLRDGLVVAGKD